MIGQIITDDTGIPLDSGGNKLSPSAYQPSYDVKQLFARVQKDYQVAWALQHRPFKEFDGHSLLQRARLDQETFGAYVGAEYLPIHKRWRWRGRKNTARNKLIGILAHMIVGMLYPTVHAKNEEDEEDKMTARVMRILVEDKLKKAGYEMKFLFMVLSALVNPAVFVQVEYVIALQRIKQRLQNGKIQVTEAVDDLLSGMNLNIVPIDELLLGDFFTFDLQKQPVILRVRRISWDIARKIYGKNQDFQYVQAGQTRIMLAGQENQELYDIEWTEADRNYVQEITAYYRDEDLEVCFVGGVFMGEQNDIYNANPFKSRRLSYINSQWISIPIYPFAKTGYEPLDPTMRFAYYKSGAFKEFWDDKAINTMHQLVLDGTYLDVIKPIFLSGAAKIDSTVMIPGAVIGMPPNASATPYAIGPNLAAAYNAIKQQEQDMSVSTQDATMSGATNPNVTATQTAVAVQQAKVSLGLFGIMIASLIEQVGDLTVDSIVQHETIGEVDTSVPEALRMKYKSFLVKGKDNGKNVTNKVTFTDAYLGQKLSKKKIDDIEWGLYDKNGGYDGDQRSYVVNPYQFARHRFSLIVDADQLTMKALGADRQQNILAFQMMTDPRVAPFTDQEAVVDDFVIEEFSKGDPDKYKKKGGTLNPMMQAVMGGKGGQSTPTPAQTAPVQAGQLPALIQ